MNRLRIKSIFLFLLFSISYLDTAHGWHDETHLAIAKAAKYSKWYSAVGADMAKIKAGSTEPYNHYFDNTNNSEITPEMVSSQINRYNKPGDVEGHLYGAIIASLREYQKTVQAGKYPEYHIAFCAHYIGDLSQPFHNTPYDDFNKTHHTINDGEVENEVLKNIDRIEKHMYLIFLNPAHFEEDLLREIARIANISRKLGLKLRTENRDMTKGEAYIQIGHSASLFKAVLKYLGKID